MPNTIRPLVWRYAISTIWIYPTRCMWSGTNTKRKRSISLIKDKFAMDGTRKFKRSAKDEKTQHPPKRKKLDAITQPSIRQHDLRGASSSNRSGKVGDFATLERQRAQSSRRS